MAFHADLTVHHLDQMLADRQTQAGTTVFTGGGNVSLLESLEQFGLFIRLDADASVLYLKAQADYFVGGRCTTDCRILVRQTPDAERNAAMVGELGRIAGEVEQNLA